MRAPSFGGPSPSAHARDDDFQIGPARHCLGLLHWDLLQSPIARLCYRAFGRLMIVQEFAGAPSFFSPFAVLVLLIFLFRRVALYPVAYPDAVLVLCEAGLWMTKLLTSPMKLAFG